MARRVDAFLCCAVSIAGCGGGDGSLDAARADAGTDAPSIDGASDASVVTPALPEPPRLTPCAAGWVEREVDGVAICDPWPSGAPLDCALGEMQLPGSPACEAVTSACAADGWPEGIAPGATVLYVRLGASAGDGTRVAPFGEIATALAAAPDGAVIAVAPGLYEERLVLNRPVTLVGACLETILHDTSAPITIHASDVSIRNLRIRSDGNAIFAGTDGVLDVRDVVFEDIGNTVLSSLVGTIAMTVSHVSIRGAGFAAFLISGGSSLTLRSVEVRDADDTVFHFVGGSGLLEDVVVRGLRRSASLPLFMLATASEVSLSRLVLDDSGTSSLHVLDGATVTASDCFVRTNATDSDGDLGWAAIDSALTIDRVAFLRPTFGIVGVGTASVTARDVVMADVVVNLVGRGEGVEATQGADMTLERISIARVTAFALLAANNGTRIDATDLDVREMIAAPDGAFGRALQVQQGAFVTVERARFDGAREAAVVVADNAMVTLSDLTVSRTAEASCGGACASAGVGLGVYLRGAMSVRRFLVEESALVGMQLAYAGEMDLEDGVVARSPVGINVQIPGYDVARLMRNVAFVDNGMNLDSSDLPVPALSTP